MIKEFLKIIFLLWVSVSIKAQSFDLIPEKENPYQGGAAQFYKDLNDILIKNDFKPCRNRMSEMFSAKIQIIDGKGIITNENIEKDCPSELFIKAFDELNRLKKWNEHSEKKKSFSVIFYPVDYFGNFKEGYTPEGLKKDAQFPGGLSKFRELVGSNLKKQNINNTGKTAVVHFKINTDGVLSQIIVESADLDNGEKEKIIKAVEKVNKKWSPMTFRNNPVTSSYRLSVKL